MEIQMTALLALLGIIVIMLFIVLNNQFKLRKEHEHTNDVYGGVVGSIDKYNRDVKDFITSFRETLLNVNHDVNALSKNVNLNKLEILEQVSENSRLIIESIKLNGDNIKDKIISLLDTLVEVEEKKLKVYENAKFNNVLDKDAFEALLIQLAKVCEVSNDNLEANRRIWKMFNSYLEANKLITEESKTKQDPIAEEYHEDLIKTSSKDLSEEPYGDVNTDVLIPIMNFKNLDSNDNSTVNANSGVKDDYRKLSVREAESQNPSPNLKTSDEPKSKSRPVRRRGGKK